MTATHARHKDWTTLVREMKYQQQRNDGYSRMQGVGSGDKDYFRPMKHGELRAAPHHLSHLRDGVGQARRVALGRYSRNNPHVSISFPFRNGDPLTTYMVWTPHPNHLLQVPPYPPLSNRTKSQQPYTPKTMGNVFQDQMKSTYVTEISEIPRKKYDRNMKDHFANPRMDERRSKYTLRRQVVSSKLM